MNRYWQLGLLLQLPRIAKAIRAEQQWLQKQAQGLQLHGIISDNRYGLYHQNIPSVIMTHQLRVRSGTGRMVDDIVQRTHYRFLNRFQATWIVDVPTLPGLGAALSHPARLPQNASYLGLLSRYACLNGEHDFTNEVLVLLSGPEPARTQLSEKLWQQALSYGGKVVFVEGSDAVARPIVPPHITWHARLAADELLQAVQSSATVLCRSGYSTLMDLVALGKKAVLVPTPAQTEQEYLGKLAAENGWFTTIREADIEMKKAVDSVNGRPFKSAATSKDFALYKNVLEAWIEKL